MKENEYSEIAGIKIITGQVSVDLIKRLQKYRKDAISTIKNDIISGNYALSCNYISESDKFKNLIQFYEELTRAGYKAETYMSGKKENIKIFRNWAKTCDEIDAEQDLIAREESE